MPGPTFFAPRCFLALPVATATLLTLGLTGCSTREPAVQAADRPETLIIAGWDTSRSNTAQLADQVEIGARLIRRFDPDRTRLVCFRVDSDCLEFFDNRVPESMDALLETLTDQLSAPARKPGTNPAPFWAAAAERTASAAGPVVIVFHSDGQIDDQSPKALRALHTAAARLAENPHVRRVAIWGVTASSRAPLRRLLAPLADRLELCGESDMNPDTLEASSR